MENIYLIASDDDFLIRKNIEKIKSKLTGFEEVSYDLKEDSLTRVIEDLDTLNFLVSGKVVVAHNAYFLTSEKPKNVIEQNIEFLEKYIKNPNPDNVLILTCKRLDERKGIVKLLKKSVKIVETSLDIYKLITENLEDYRMDRDAQKFLIDRTLNNYERVINELEKLKLYKYDSKVITKEDVENLVTKTIDDNIFALIDSILAKDKKNAFMIYEDMLLHNEEPMKILILLANKIRLLYQVKVLAKTIYSDEEIGRIIGSHPYPVKLARGIIHKFSEKDLLKYLHELSNIDISVKTGKTYQNIGLEQFILTL